MRTKEFNLRVLFRREGEGWVAQCLEYDIVAQGSTLDKAKHRMQRTLIGQIIVDVKHGREPYEGIKQAPILYWREFDKGQRFERQPQFYLPEEINRMPFRAVVEDMRVFA